MSDTRRCFLGSCATMHQDKSSLPTDQPAGPSAAGLLAGLFFFIAVVLLVGLIGTLMYAGQQRLAAKSLTAELEQLNTKMSDQVASHEQQIESITLSHELAIDEMKRRAVAIRQELGNQQTQAENQLRQKDTEIHQLREQLRRVLMDQSGSNRPDNTAQTNRPSDAATPPVDIVFSKLTDMRPDVPQGPRLPFPRPVAVDKPAGSFQTVRCLHGGIDR
ncbi:MAG: hypothetical protein AAGB26_13000 [Planctomycetota bacterium]